MPVHNRGDTEFWCRRLQEAVPIREIAGLWVIRLAGVPKVETRGASIHATFAEFWSYVRWEANELEWKPEMNCTRSQETKTFQGKWLQRIYQNHSKLMIWSQFYHDGILLIWGNWCYRVRLLAWQDRGPLQRKLSFQPAHGIERKVENCEVINEDIFLKNIYIILKHFSAEN